MDQSFWTCHKFHGLIFCNSVVGAKNRRSRQGSTRQWGFSTLNKIRGPQGDLGKPQKSKQQKCLPSQLAGVKLLTTTAAWTIIATNKTSNYSTQMTVNNTGMFPRTYSWPATAVWAFHKFDISQGPTNCRRTDLQSSFKSMELVEEMEHDLHEAVGALSLATNRSTTAGVFCRPTHSRPALMWNFMPR
ncbi:hypothetical protein FOIG_15151 [Fusarium odoratissimum NRRL 54006]|uniref:Uncharacterized protein n=2 Tax=Fusarium oxysporum species complex TaxID=171631 RepID=X0IRX6_FUSO5|nr:uncharacterized protein FOIG_15151 [Fusarium odoratissimum NRRL 54006]EXL91612.1 hypothetical protein FOIG_15151 [Fusarium odoratissimum NRRL 54006]TXC08787.1 hypothetical protein FocTR4_00003413 [Fusarium oxysporum f. sp. cubense]